MSEKMDLSEVLDDAAYDLRRLSELMAAIEDQVDCLTGKQTSAIAGLAAKDATRLFDLLQLCAIEAAKLEKAAA